MTLFLFALLIVGAALAFIYFDSHRSAAAKLQEDDQPLDIVNRKLRPRNHTILQQANVLVVHSS